MTNLLIRYSRALDWVPQNKDDFGVHLHVVEHQRHGPGAAAFHHVRRCDLEAHALFVSATRGVAPPLSVGVGGLSDFRVIPAGPIPTDFGDRVLREEVKLCQSRWFIEVEGASRGL